MTRKFDVLSVGLIIAAIAATLLFNIGEIPPPYPWSDESEIAADAVDTLKYGPSLFYSGQLAGGSLAVWLEAFWMLLFGRDLIGLRVLNGLVNLGTALGLYALVRRLPLGESDERSEASYKYTPWVALMAALLFAVSTWVLGLGRIATPNWSLVPLLTVLAFLAFWHGLETQQMWPFYATGAILGLQFYGYLPGYAVILIPVVCLAVMPDIKRQWRKMGLMLGAALIVAVPMLGYFALHPAALLQRPQQLTDTNNLGLAAVMGQSALDMLRTFGLWPDWFLQLRFEHLAFEPLTTVLFVAGLLIAIWRLRQNRVYGFLLLWWLVMLLPALLSRSASQGFIFEVWRRGIGAQPVSFIFPAIALVSLMQFRRLWLPSVTPVVIVMAAVSSYGLYFGQWANSGAMDALFAKGPVEVVEWMQANSNPETAFVIPIRPNVSPTTRPELFTIRYLYDGDSPLVITTQPDLPTDDLSTVILMLHDRIPVDPAGAFEYHLSVRGDALGVTKLFDYMATTYRLNPGSVVTTEQVTSYGFSDGLQWLSITTHADKDLSAGQTLGVQLAWQRESDTAHNAVVSFHDGNGYEYTRSDKFWSPSLGKRTYHPLLIPGDTPPGNYTLRVTAYHPGTGERLQPLDRGNADLSLDIGTIAVWVAREQHMPGDIDTAYPRSVSFQDQLLLRWDDTSLASQPGDTIWLPLVWEMQRATSRKIGLMLALASNEGASPPLFEDYKPLIMDYPTSMWGPNRPFRVHYPVLLPAQLETGPYQIAMRLVDLDTQTPLDGDVLLMPIDIQARDHVFDAPLLAQVSNATFGEHIELRSYEVEVISPIQINVTLQWHAHQEMRESYKMFLHLVDPAGTIISQVDTIPQQGAAPTTSWVRDEIIEDDVSLMVTATPSEGYSLRLGLYNADTGHRLPTGLNDYVVLVEK